MSNYQQVDLLRPNPEIHPEIRPLKTHSLKAFLSQAEAYPSHFAFDRFVENAAGLFVMGKNEVLKFPHSELTPGKVLSAAERWDRAVEEFHDHQLTAPGVYVGLLRFRVINDVPLLDLSEIDSAPTMGKSLEANERIAFSLRRVYEAKAGIPKSFGKLRRRILVKTIARKIRAFQEHEKTEVPQALAVIRLRTSIEKIAAELNSRAIRLGHTKNYTSSSIELLAGLFRKFLVSPEFVKQASGLHLVKRLRRANWTNVVSGKFRPRRSRFAGIVNVGTLGLFVPRDLCGHPISDVAILKLQLERVGEHTLADDFVLAYSQGEEVAQESLTVHSAVALAAEVLTSDAVDQRLYAQVLRLCFGPFSPAVIVSTENECLSQDNLRLLSRTLLAANVVVGDGDISQRLRILAQIRQTVGAAQSVHVVLKCGSDESFVRDLEVDIPCIRLTPIGKTVTRANVNSQQLWVDPSRSQEEALEDILTAIRRMQNSPEFRQSLR